MNSSDKQAVIAVLEGHDIEVADPETGELYLRLSVEKAAEIVDLLVSSEERDESTRSH